MRYLVFMKKSVFIILICVLFVNAVRADGWIYDGYNNWQYEENGELVRNTWKNIDGVNYYFDTKGNWLPTKPEVNVKLKTSERVTFIMEGKDYSNRKYKTEISIPMPILSGTNEEALNEFIKKEFQNTIKKYVEERMIKKLFLTPKIELAEIFEIYNVHDVVGIGYIGDTIFNLYIDAKKLEMWADK